MHVIAAVNLLINTQWKVLLSAKTGHSRAQAPIRYVVVDPMLQNAMLATTGPTALASAPSERNMPKTVPFCCGYPYIDAIVIMQDTTIAVARNK